MTGTMPDEIPGKVQVTPQAGSAGREAGSLPAPGQITSPCRLLLFNQALLPSCTLTNLYPRQEYT